MGSRANHHRTPALSGRTTGLTSHHSTVITIRGDSHRLREKRRFGLLQKAKSTLRVCQMGVESDLGFSDAVGV